MCARVAGKEKFIETKLLSFYQSFSTFCVVKPKVINTIEANHRERERNEMAMRRLNIMTGWNGCNKYTASGIGSSLSVNVRRF